MWFHKAIATLLGIGYAGKGSGTLAALAVAAVWYVAWHGSLPPVLASALACTLLVCLGIWSSGAVSRLWGKDPARVVVDEAAGMSISLLFLPADVTLVVAAFILFRVFDIVKPFGIRNLEQIAGGWGIMLDDIAAGLYVNVLLQILVLFRLS